MSDGVCRNKYVKAIHPFKPTHTDELCFQKGDLILVTQAIDGGWWEGTFNGFTGWFPSNYVTETVVNNDKSPLTSNGDSRSFELDSNEETANRELVMESLKSLEKCFIMDMKVVLKDYISCPDFKTILPNSDLSQLITCIEDLINLHVSLLRELESTLELPVSSQRIGQLFLKFSNQMLICHKGYCSIHPRIAILMLAKKDELNRLVDAQRATTPTPLSTWAPLPTSSSSSSSSSPSPGCVFFTGMLSKPLRLVEKYANVLQEVYRYNNENHIDGVELMQAVGIYRDIFMSCCEARRRKEMEQDILSSDIRGWRGELLSQLGEIQLLSHCRVITTSSSSSSTSTNVAPTTTTTTTTNVAELLDNKKDRLLLLCSSYVLLLSISPRSSGYSYEGRIPTYGAIINSLEDVVVSTGCGGDDDDDGGGGGGAGVVLEYAFEIIVGGSTANPATNTTTTADDVNVINNHHHHNNDNDNSNTQDNNNTTTTNSSNANATTRYIVLCNTHQEKMNWLQMLKQPVKLGPANAVYKNFNKMSSPSGKQFIDPHLTPPAPPPPPPLTTSSTTATGAYLNNYHNNSNNNVTPTPQQQQSNRSSLLFNLSQQKQQSQQQSQHSAPPLPLFTPSGYHHHQQHQQQQQQNNNIYATPQQNISTTTMDYNPNEVTLSNSQFYLPSFVSISNNNSSDRGNDDTTSSSSNKHRKKLHISNLRPYPPLRPSFSLKDDGARSPRFNKRIMGSSRKKPGERASSQEDCLVYKKIDDTKVLQEDALMLKVIEAYCTSTKNRQAINSLDLSKIRLTQNELQKELWDALFEHPQVLIAEEEKIILEDVRDDQIVVEEKTLVDTVYSLRDQIKDIIQEQQSLRRELESERKARRALEIFVRQSVKTSQPPPQPPPPQPPQPSSSSSLNSTTTTTTTNNYNNTTTTNTNTTNNSLDKSSSGGGGGSTGGSNSKSSNIRNTNKGSGGSNLVSNLRRQSAITTTTTTTNINSNSSNCSNSNALNDTII